VAVAAGEEEAVASGEEEGLLRLRELFSAEGLGAGGAGGGGGVGEAARSSPAAVAGGGRPSKRSSDAMDIFLPSVELLGNILLLCSTFGPDVSPRAFENSTSSDP
jgi:hypothetical protein